MSYWMGAEWLLYGHCEWVLAGEWQIERFQQIAFA